MTTSFLRKLRKTPVWKELAELAALSAPPEASRHGLPVSTRTCDVSNHRRPWPHQSNALPVLQVQVRRAEISANVPPHHSGIVAYIHISERTAILLDTKDMARYHPRTPERHDPHLQGHKLLSTRLLVALDIAPF